MPSYKNVFKLITAKKNKKYFICFVIFILVFSFYLLIQNKSKKTTVQELKNGWSFILKDHSDQYIYGNTHQRIEKIHANDLLIMQKPLEMVLDSPEIALKTNHQWVTVLLGDKQIYRYKALDDQDKPGILQTTITLPKDFQGQKLRIITESPYNYHSGVPAQVFIGNSEDIDRYLIFHSLPQFILLAIVLTLLTAIGILFILKKDKSRAFSQSTIFLLGFIFCIGIQAHVSNNQISLLFHPELIALFSDLSLLLLPIFLTNYYLSQTNRYRVFYRLAVFFQTALTLCFLILALLGQTNLPIAVHVFSGFNVFITLYTAVISMFEAADENHFFIVCSPGIILAAFIHCFYYIQLFTGTVNLTTDWPLIIFSCLMILISGYYFTENYFVLKQQQARRLEEQQLQLIEHEKQVNLLLTFKLLAVQRYKTENYSLNELFQVIEDYYQKEFAKQAKFFNCQLTIPSETAFLKEHPLLVVIQLLEKLLNSSDYSAVELKIKQQAGQLIIESNTSNFVRHSLELINEAETDPTHQKIKETIRRSDGHWAWENNGKEQSFKIILTL